MCLCRRRGERMRGCDRKEGGVLIMEAEQTTR